MHGLLLYVHSSFHRPLRRLPWREVTGALARSPSSAGDRCAAASAQALPAHAGPRRPASPDVQALPHEDRALGRGHNPRQHLERTPLHGDQPGAETRRRLLAWKTWNEQEIAFLREHSGSMSVKRMAKALR